MIFPKKVLTIALAVIVLAALFYFVIFKKAPDTGEPGEDSAGGEITQALEAGGADRVSEEIPLSVRAVTAGREDLVIRIKSPGEAFTENKAVIKAEVSGVVRDVKAAEGQHVKGGEVLIVLDYEAYKLALEKAEAIRLDRLSVMLMESQFSGPSKEIEGREAEKIRKSAEDFEKAAARLARGDIARDEYEKTRKSHEALLIEAGLMKDEIQAASKGLTQAEIDVAAARTELEKTRIRAAFDGIVTGVKVFAGESVVPGQELFTLVNIRHIRVEAKVLESEIGRIQAGREADFRFSAYPNRIFKGRVIAVSPVVSPEDKTCAVHISVENPSEELKPGMHAEAEIAAEIYKDRLLVPQEAVLVRGGRKLVFVVEEGLAKWTYVETGLENERFVEVLEGLKSGDMVITEGHLTLAHDARVNIME